MSDILDIADPPAPDEAALRAVRKRKGRLWTCILLAAILAYDIAAIKLLRGIKGHETGFTFKAAFYFGTFLGAMLVTVSAGMIVWLLVWPFVRKKMRWHYVAMYSSFVAMLFFLLSLLQVVMHWG